MFRCSNCLRPYPVEGLPYKCQHCGGVFEIDAFPIYDPNLVDDSLRSIWRYRHTFGLRDSTPPISLGEGATPLIWTAVFDRQVAFKLEYQNPTGSHKDRGVSILASILAGMGIRSAVEDSSGNAGASLAAYSARAGINAKIYIPDYASGPKKAQIEAYGAELVRILGSRSAVAEAVLKTADSGAVYASHAYLPQLLPGYATIAYEIVEELDRAPGTIVAPVGHGSLLFGVGLGFQNLVDSGVIEKMPRLIGVQSLACAPVWAVYTMGAAGHSWVTEGMTLAEGVRVRYPLQGDGLIKQIEGSGGTMFAVEEEKILPDRDNLGRLGYYVEPTSAIVYDALRQGIHNFSDPIIVLLTGAGYKSKV